MFLNNRKLFIKLRRHYSRVAVDDAYTFVANTPLTVSPLENDTDADSPIGLLSAEPSGNFTIIGNSLQFSGLAVGTHNLFYTIIDLTIISPALTSPLPSSCQRQLTRRRTPLQQHQRVHRPQPIRLSQRRPLQRLSPVR
jgi:hypothetical protein